MKNEAHHNHYSEFMRKIFRGLVARLQSIEINGAVCYLGSDFMLDKSEVASDYRAAGKIQLTLSTQESPSFHVCPT